ncbi:MAG TPA: signal peptidase II [Tissierellaceae bacterium]|nr:signal peptidase II [Tissierellaceae bacterium]
MVFILSIIVVIVDQISKYFVIDKLKGTVSHVIIPGFLKFTYVENYGAAFGILKNKKIFFIIITLIIVIFISLFLVKYYYKISFFMRIGLGLLLGGAIGNLIDRVRFGYVVDFINVRLFNFYDYPVFNIADISIVFGTIIILILTLFDKHEI